MADGELDTLPGSWLLCRAGRHLCALPLDEVVETTRILPIEVLSAAPRFVRGFCVYRGSPVLVVDAALVLGQEETRAERLVVIRTGSRTVALCVGGVLGVRAFGAEAAQTLPPLLGEAASDAVSAIGVLDEELMLFLRAARIVPEALFANLAAEAPEP